jgi:hypothetical protein
MGRDSFGVNSKTSGDTLSTGRFLCAGGEIFVIMSSFTLQRKLFSMQTKPSRFKVNRGEGKLTKRRRVIEEVAGRCNIGASARVSISRCSIFAFCKSNELRHLVIH